MYKSEKSAYGERAVISSGCGAAFRFILVAFLAFMLLSVSQVYAGNGDVSITVTTETIGTDITASSTVEAMCAGGGYQTCTAASPAVCTNAQMIAAGPGGGDCTDNEAITIRVTKDGYVQKIDALQPNWLAASNPNTYTITNIQYGYKITAINAEATSAVLTPTTLTVGDVTGFTTCSMVGAVGYCPVTIANSNDGSLTGVVTLDGYVETAAGYALTSTAARANDAVAQVSTTITAVQYAYKITGITSEGPGTDLVGLSTGLTVGDVTGKNTCSQVCGAGCVWYCPVVLANSNAEPAGVTTLSGYVEEALDLVGTDLRTANSDPQRSTTLSGVKYGYKITSIPAEGSSTELKATVTGVKAGNAQGTTCAQSGGNWYCAVPLADTTLAIQVAKDGYVKDTTSLNFTTDRTLATAAQETATTGSVKHNYRFKVWKMDGSTVFTGLTSGDFTFGATSVDFYEVGAGVYDVAFTDAGGAVVTRKFNKDGYTTAANNMGNSAIVANQPAARVDDSGSAYTPTGNYKTAIYKRDGATPLTGLVSANFTFFVPHTDFKETGAGVYEFAIPAGGATVTRQVAANGYVANLPYAVSSAITSQPAAQVDDTVGKKITLIGNYQLYVQDEFGNNVLGLVSANFTFGRGHTDFADVSNAGIYEFAIPAGAATTISVAKVGYVTNASQTTSGALGNTQLQDFGGNNVSLYTTVKVIVVDVAGNPVTGATVNITNGINATDGDLTNDINDGANGNISIAQDPSGLPGGPHTITVSKAGYLNWINSTITINSSAQTVYTTALLSPTVVSINPNNGSVNSSAVNSSAIISVTGFAPNSALTVRFNNTVATILSGGTTSATGNATYINVTIPLLVTGSYNVNVTDASGNNKTSTNGFTVIDIFPPVINSVYLNESDNFVSATAPNNNITLMVNATDIGYGSNGIKYLTANFSDLNQAGITLVNMTRIGTTDIWNASITVTNVAAFNFQALNITVFGYDNSSIAAVGQGFYTVVLYNMTTPPAGDACMQWDTSLTTDLSKATNFSSVNYVMGVKINVSCYMPGMIPPGAPAWLNNFTLLGLVNFTSLNMSDPAIGAQLALLPTNFDVSITPPGQFGDSRIYFNTTALAAFNTTASVSMYHLPFSSQPVVAADAVGGGSSSSLVWVQGTGEGTLTFTVNHFSGYNVTDNVVPIISVVSPANMTSTNDATPLINVSINGTGTQLSYASIVISNGSAPASYVYDVRNMSAIVNTSQCTSLAAGSENFTCLFNSSSLADGSYSITVTALDFGGVTGNNKTAVTNFTVYTGVPVVTLVTPLNATVTKSATILFNWTAVDGVYTTTLCNLTINGTLNQSNINSTLSGFTNVSVSGFVNGTYTWSVSCGNRVGAVGTSSTYTLVIDNVAPVATLLSPANGTVTNELNGSVLGNVSLWFNVTDNVASLVNCNVSWITGQQSFTNVTANGNSYSGGNLAGADGSVQWYVNCSDSAGNVGTSGTYTFIRDTVAPVINYVNLNRTYMISGTAVLIIVNATDATTSVKNVTANGVLLNSSSGLWNGTITLTGNGAGYVTIVAMDNASNTNTSASLANASYTIDNAAPVITLNSPTNGSTAISTAGELTINWTVTEANISASNISIDNGVWTASNNSNGTRLAYLTGVSAGTHTLVIYALDNASLSATSTTTFILSTPVNATAELASMQSSVGNGTLTNITLSDVATNTNQSGNQTLNVSQPLKLDMGINASAGANATVTIPAFTGTNANWNATTFSITTNLTGNVALNTSVNTGSSIIAMVSFINMSNFLPNTAYTNGTIITFQRALSGLDVLYISDDTGNIVYKLSACSGGVAPATISSATMCYLNTSTNVTVYIPHLSGAALSNDTVAPTVNVTSPTNGATIANSYATLSFDVWEANPNATRFCWYNLTNATPTQIIFANLTTANFTQVGTKYSFSTIFSALPNLAYNITVNCTDQNGNSTQVLKTFTIADTTAPAVTAISNSVSGTSVTITVTTDEIAVCRYYASDANYSNMTNFTTTGALSHSVTISSLSAGTYTYYVRCNDTAGNNMTSSNTTTFTISASGGSCIPSWTCTEWTTCSPINTQIRSCTDANLCGTVVNKPPEAQYCIYNAPATCTGTCGTGYYQQPYPACGCVLLVCTNTCPSGQTMNAYPDCGCVSPPSNVTGPGNITITPKRDGVVIDIPGMAVDRSTSLGSYLTTAVKDATGVLDIVLTPNKDLTGVKVDITKLAAKPATIAAPQGIVVYNYLEIKATNLTSEDLVNATVTFKVPKAYIGTKYNASSTVLMRLVGTEWTVLDTKIASQTTTDYIFESETPGFSYFAIAIAEMGAGPIVIIPPINGTNGTGPVVPPIDISTIAIWIAGIVVAAGIIAFAYNAVKSQKKWKPRSPK